MENLEVRQVSDEYREITELIASPDIEVRKLAARNLAKLALRAVESEQDSKALSGLLSGAEDDNDRGMLDQIELDLSQSHERYRRTIMGMPDTMFFLDRDSIFRGCVTSDLVPLAIAEEEFIGKTIEDVMPPEIAEQGRNAINNVFENDELQIFEYQLDMPDGLQFFEMRIVRIGSDEVLGMARNITDHKLLENELQAKHDRLESMIFNISDVIGIIGIDGTMQYISPNVEKFFGWKPDDLIGTDGWLIIHPDDLENLKKDFIDLLANSDADKKVEFRYKCKDGSYRYISGTASNLIDSPLVGGILLNYHDISERKQLEEEIFKLTLHDELTGLGNRRYLQQRMNEIELSGRRHPISILSIDITDFKQVNDIFGHAAGDRVLKEVAKVLRETLRPDDCLVRMGGDEFVAVIEHANEEIAESVVARIHLRMAEVSAMYPVKLSIGFATSHDRLDNLDEIYSIADTRMYGHKRTQKTGKDLLNGYDILLSFDFIPDLGNVTVKVVPLFIIDLNDTLPPT